MSLNLQCNPKIFIGNNEIGFDTFSVSNPGVGLINSASIKTFYS